jgi:hypothetical protein
MYIRISLHANDFKINTKEKAITIIKRVYLKYATLMILYNSEVYWYLNLKWQHKMET